MQSFYYPKKRFELAELTLEQDLLGRRLNLLVGRANATGEFGTLDLRLPVPERGGLPA